MIIPNPLKAILAILYPKICLGCENEHPVANHITCVNCLASLPFTDHFNKKENSFSQHFWGRVPIEYGAALMSYNPSEISQRLLHNFKYRGHTEIGELLGKLIGERLISSWPIETIDIIIPVPLTKKKKGRRGYNQSEVLARGIESVIKIPVAADALIRTKESDSQTKKNRGDRISNMKDAFQLQNAPLIAGKHVLLVDDVMTTGATLESCAIELLQSCRGISFTTLAMGSQL